MKKILFILIFGLMAITASAQDMLQEQVPGNKLLEILIPHEKYSPIPKTSNREFWNGIQDTVKELYIDRAEKLIDYQWPSLPATMALRFVRDGNRSEYQKLHFTKRGNLGTLVIAEAIENKGRFLDQVVDGIWSMCEESYWGVPAHLKHSNTGEGLPDVNDPWVDLFAAETVNHLAWADYLLGPQLDNISPMIRERIRYEANKRIFEPILNQRHIWMDFTFNWNPWICSNWLSSILLLEDDQQTRALHVDMVLESLDIFLNAYPEDGGCDEGPGYWNAAGASLFESLEIMNLATDGQFQVFGNQKIRNIGSYIYKVQISDNRFINFADADPVLHPDGHWVYHFGKRIDDQEMMNFGAYYFEPGQLVNGRSHFTRCLILLKEGYTGPGITKNLPLPGNVWLSDIEVMVSRDYEGSDKGLFLAVKGGHNAEAHNHNDVGNFIVYYDGKPLIIDAGRGSYTAKFFSNERYSLWMTNSAHHNVPLINNIEQPTGLQYRAALVNYSKKNNKAELSLDISAAYPEEAGLDTWMRTITHNKRKNITIEEEIELNIAGSFSEVFMTVANPDVSQKGIVRLHLPDDETSLAFVLKYDPSVFTATYKKMPMELPEDEGIMKNWETDIFRVELSTRGQVKKGTYKLKLEKEFSK